MSWFDFASSALGSILGAVTENRNTDAVNEANAKTLERQIEANKETMQNRHQWEVSDLKSAGLNPLLSTTSPTGTLSAPNASPAQKSNSSQAFFQLADMFMKNKELDIEKTNAKANMYNADTNRLNAINSAEGAKAALDEERSKNRAQYEIATVQLKQGWKQLGLQEALNKANISKIEQDTIYQKTLNEWAPKLQKAQHDEIVGRIANEAKVAAATVYNLHVTADSAASQAASAAIIAKSTASLNKQMEGLTKAQKLAVLNDTVQSIMDMKLSLPGKMLQAYEDGKILELYENDENAFWFSVYWHNLLPVKNGAGGLNFRPSKYFGIRD